uniref:Sperm associated antigen 16 n=1 Tax=Amazona collaria TaxID=241587 RepID=A0A8B9G6E7_9PSIT
MDDFFCNFLVRLGMSRTLNCFQTEWYELVQRGLLTAKDIELVPTVYTRNQQLEAENMRLKKDLENYKHAANKAKEAFLKMQKERDFHRMHHKRVVQEKNRLICDIKRLKAHYASYEPVLKQLTEKYQTVLRQKMLTTLERDRAVGQVNTTMVNTTSIAVRNAFVFHFGKYTGAALRESAMCKPCYAFTVDGLRKGVIFPQIHMLPSVPLQISYLFFPRITFPSQKKIHEDIGQFFCFVSGIIE